MSIPFLAIPACSPDRDLSSIPLIEPPLPGVAPTVNDQNVSVRRNESVTIIVVGADGDGDPLTFSVINEPQYGTLGQMEAQGSTSISVRYTPETDYAGLDEFRIQASDGGRSATGVVKIQILNGTPSANSVNMRVPRTRASEVPLSGSDPDGDPLTFHIASTPAVGRLGEIFPEGPNTARITFEPFLPESSEQGSVSFVYQADDGGSMSPSATVDLRLNRVPLVPSETGIQVGISPKDDPVSILLEAFDEDSDPLTFTIESAPKLGNLKDTDALEGRVFSSFEPGPQVTYLPDPGYVGLDQFTYMVHDGFDPSAIVTVSIVVENGRPEAIEQTVSTRVQTPVEILLEGIDPDDDPLAFEISQEPGAGTLGPLSSIGDASASITYTPGSEFSGEDRFFFLVRDALDQSDPAEVIVRVVNQGPLAEQVVVNTPKNISVTVPLVGSDPDGAELQFTVTELPNHGTLGDLQPNGFNAFEIEYTPNVSFSGQDRFRFRVSDGTGGVAEANAFINVINTPPAGDDVDAETDKNVPVAVGVMGTDPDGDPLTFDVASPPNHGDVIDIRVIDNGQIIVDYMPDPNFVGVDTFKITVMDAAGAVETITVTITVVNSAPTTSDINVTTTKNTSVIVTMTGTDPNGDPITFKVADGPDNGSVGPMVSTGPTSARVTYTPNPGYGGTDQFTFSVDDGGGIPSQGIATIQITNVPPSADNQGLSTGKNIPTVITLTGSDSDGDALSFEITSGPTSGMLGPISPVDPTSATTTYTPATDFEGTASFTFRVNDGTANSTSAMVTIEVLPDPPQADPTTVSTVRNISIFVPITGSDPEGDPLTFDVADPPNGLIGFGGSITPTGPASAQFFYIPDAGFTGPDVFDFTVDDGTTTSAPAQITVNVEDPPLLYAFGFSFGGSPAITDTRTNTFLGHMKSTFLDPSINTPRDGVLASDGRTFYALSQLRSQIFIYDLTPNKVTRVIDFSSIGDLPFGIALSPDETTLYIADFGLDEVLVMDIASGTITHRIPFGPGPTVAGSNPVELAVSLDGSKVYVATQMPSTTICPVGAPKGEVRIIDTATNTITTTITMSGEFTQHVVLTPDGTQALVANGGQCIGVADQVEIIDLSTNTITETITVGDGATRIGITPDGTEAYVTNTIDNTVSVIDLATNTVVATIPVGPQPIEVVFSPNGQFAYVSQFGESVSNHVGIIDTSTRTVVGSATGGSKTSLIVVAR